MKRFVAILVLLVLVVGALVPNVAAQDAPDGTWLGTWPYYLPPEHHFNGFATGGPNENLGNLYRSMVEMPGAFYMWGTDEFVGLLAESWGFVEDNTAYEMTLRSDALWSNGSQVDADDLITTFALLRLLGDPMFTQFDEVEKVSDFTVRLHFIDEPSLLGERQVLKSYIVADDTYGELAARALELFASNATSDSEEWQALRTELQEFRPESLIASGPYVYTLDDVGDSYMILHWQPNSIFSDSVKFGELKLWAGETDSTTPLVLSGEIAQSTNVYPPATIEAFQNAGIEIVAIPRGYGPALLFNHAKAPWNILEVRQAVALVIERSQNAFLTNGLGATATVYMCGIADSSVPAMLTEDVIEQLDHYDYDPDRAAALLESVGYTRNADGKWVDAEGKTISAEWVFPAEFADFSGATQDAVAQMNAFGFDITARALPWQEVPTEIKEGTFDLSIWSWGLGNPLASRQFWNPIQRWMTDGANMNPGQPGLAIDLEFELDGEMVNLDDLINNVNSGLDREEHRVRASQVALFINQTMPFVPLNMLVSAEPFNTDLISGRPAEGDPILLNPSGVDHFIVYYLLTGVLGPAN